VAERDCWAKKEGVSGRVEGARKLPRDSRGTPSINFDLVIKCRSNGLSQVLSQLKVSDSRMKPLDDYFPALFSGSFMGIVNLYPCGSFV